MQKTHDIYKLSSPYLNDSGPEVSILGYLHTLYQLSTLNPQPAMALKVSDSGALWTVPFQMSNLYNMFSFQTTNTEVFTVGAVTVELAR